MKEPTDLFTQTVNDATETKIVGGPAPEEAAPAADAQAEKAAPRGAKR